MLAVRLQADEAGTIKLKPFGERKGFPLPLKASGAFCIMPGSPLVGNNPGQAMFEAVWMRTARAERGRTEPGGTAGPSWEHIWAAHLALHSSSARGHCAISASMH